MPEETVYLTEIELEIMRAFMNQKILDDAKATEVLLTLARKLRQ